MSKLGIGLVGVGALFLILAAFAYAYQETRTLYGVITVTAPYYRDYTLPLVLVAVACFVIGFAMIVNERLNEQKK